MSKTVVVAGSTGAQGSGLVQAILADKSGEYKVRALTRNPDSEKAKALAAQGAEVVKCDIDNAEDVESAVKGAYAVFLVTFFWNHFSPEKEKENCRIFAEAAEKNGVKHVVYSTLEDTRILCPLSDKKMPVLMEKYNVPHFDGKAEGDQFFKGKSFTVSFLYTSFYNENFIHFGMGPKKGEDGVLAVTFPIGDKRLPMVSTADIGKAAFALIKNPDKYNGKYVGIAGCHCTGAEIAAAFAKVLGQEVKYNAVPPDMYRSFGFPGAAEMGNMFQYKADFNEQFCGNRSLEVSKELVPDAQDLDGFLSENKDKLPIG